jgi:hypothetical protein
MLRLLAVSLLTVALAFTALACGASNGAPGIATGPLRVTGGGASRFREASADNSLEEYGHEASRAELERAARAVHAYLDAWVTKDWDAACSLASSELHRILGSGPGQSRTVNGPRCVAAIAEVASGEPPLGNTPYEATDMDAVGLRREGNVGYLFFFLGRTAYQQEVFSDNGRWGVKAPLPSGPH